jgi:hypothetical protein
MSDLTPDLIKEAQRKAADLVASAPPGTFRRIFVNDWRGVRLLYDCLAPCQTMDQCTECGLQKLLGDESPRLATGVTTGLFEFVTPKDRRLYGPEKYLSCKSPRRIVQCFTACFLCDEDLLDPTAFREELEYLRDLLSVWPLHGAPILERNMRGEVIHAVLSFADHTRRELMRELLPQVPMDYKCPSRSARV